MFKMNTFIEKPANKQSVAQRKLVHGKGVNDAEYIVNIKNSTKQESCPFYKRWVGMLERCYSEKLHKKNPTYKDCSVCSEWLTFSNFKEWMIKQDWEGQQLDKDLILPGNKIYSPSTCVFLPSAINSLMNNAGSIRGKYPIGVSKYKKNGLYTAKISLNGKLKGLGYYKTQEEASFVYLTAKSDHIKDIVKNQPKMDERVAKALLNIATKLDENGTIKHETKPKSK